MTQQWFGIWLGDHWVTNDNTGMLLKFSSYSDAAASVEAMGHANATVKPIPNAPPPALVTAAITAYRQVLEARVH